MRAFAFRLSVSFPAIVLALLALAPAALAVPAEGFRLVIEIDPPDRPPTVPDQETFRITSPAHHGGQAAWTPEHPVRTLITESMVAGLGDDRTPSPHEYAGARYAFIVETREGGFTLTGLHGVRWMELTYDVRGDRPCRAEVTEAGVHGLSGDVPARR